MSDTYNNAAPAPPPPPAAPVPPVAYAAPVVPQLKSPAVAGVLSFLSGLGHVYLGLYTRAAIFFGIWVFTMTIASHSHGPIGIVVGFWWFFVIIDAVRQAQAINRAYARGDLPPDATPTSDDFAKIRAGGSLGLGVFLILVGAWFLIDRFVSIDLSFLLDWWPLLLVAFGAWQVFAHFKAKEKVRSDDPTV